MKYIYSFFTFLLFYTSIVAQEKSVEYTGSFATGLEIGCNEFLLMQQSLKEEFKNPGISAAAHFQYNITEKFGIISNVNYDYKRAENSSSYGKKKLTHHTLTFPIMLRHTFGRNKSFFINGGSFVSIVLIEKREDYFNSSYHTPFHPSLGWSCGAGLNILQKKRINVSFEIRDYQTVYSVNQSSDFANTITFVLGLRWKYKDPVSVFDFSEYPQ